MQSQCVLHLKSIKISKIVVYFSIQLLFCEDLTKGAGKQWCLSEPLVGHRKWASAWRKSPCSLSCPSCLKQGHNSVCWWCWNFLKCFAIPDYFRIVFPFLCLSCRLESQMTADIQTILQLLQKQTPVVPPAYSMVTAGSECQRPIIHLMRTSHPIASIKTDQSFSPSSQVSVDSVQPGVSL